MTFINEYQEMKVAAIESIAALYQSFTHKIDRVAEKNAEPWAAEWQQYRQGGTKTLSEILPLLPDWQQKNFSQFAALQKFIAEIQRAFIHYETEVTEAYRLGLQRGRELAQPATNQEWREARTYFDRMRQLERIPHSLRLCYTKELLRQRTKETARMIWPELFNEKPTNDE